MNVELDDLDHIEVHDLWSDIVHRARQHPVLPLGTIGPAGRTPARWLQVAGGLTAAACLLGGLLVVGGDDAGERQGRTPASDGATAPAVAALPRLASLALPSTIPDGWRLVNLATAPMYPNAEVTQPAGQLYRRTSDGAAIGLTIMPTDSEAEPDTTTQVDVQQRTDVAFESGFATIREAGADVRVGIAGVTDDAAARFLRELSPTGSAAELRYTSVAPGWVLEAEVDPRPSTPHRFPFGVATYRSHAGENASFRLENADPNNQMWRLGVPTDIDGVTVYRNASSAARQVGPLLVFATFDETGSTSAALELLTSFTVVDNTTWQTTASQLAAAYSALPAIGRLGIDDVTVTLHMSDDALVLCARRVEVTRCVPDQTRWYGNDRLSSFDGDVNLDGVWVHVGAYDLPGLKGITATTDAGPAQADWTNIDSNIDMNGVIIAAIAPPAATTMSVDAQENDTNFWGADTVRPVD